MGTKVVLKIFRVLKSVGGWGVVGPHHGDDVSRFQTLAGIFKVGLLEVRRGAVQKKGAVSMNGGIPPHGTITVLFGCTNLVSSSESLPSGKLAPRGSFQGRYGKLSGPTKVFNP